MFNFILLLRLFYLIIYVVYLIFNLLTFYLVRLFAWLVPLVTPGSLDFTSFFGMLLGFCHWVHWYVFLSLWNLAGLHVGIDGPSDHWWSDGRHRRWPGQEGGWMGRQHLECPPTYWLAWDVTGCWLMSVALPMSSPTRAAGHQTLRDPRRRQGRGSEAAGVGKRKRRGNRVEEKGGNRFGQASGTMPV